MTKADLVEKVTAQIARTAGPLISKKDCARVVDSFLDAVKAALAEHPVEVAARPVPVFKPSKELRAMVAEASARVTP
jgi:integration host factor subunit beta